MRPRALAACSAAALAVAAMALVAAPAAQARTTAAHRHAVHRKAGSDALQSLLMTRESVSFNSDSFALSPDSKRSLARFARRLRPQADAVRLEAIGYADSTGASPDNLLLAERRATAVLHYLHERGVSLVRISSVSYGQEAPQTSNATAEGRARNRRVVIVVLPWTGDPDGA